MKIPLVLEVNGDHLPEFGMLGVEPKGMQRKLSIALMKRAAHRASHVVATGEGWRQSFIRRWNVPTEKVTVVENGSEIVKLLRREELRPFALHTDGEESAKLIYVGAFEPWHGLTILIKAVARVIAQGVRIELTLVGDGTESGNLKQAVRKWGIEKQVNFTGYLSAPQLARQLAVADIGVSPYCGRAEFSGLKLLDYKAAGLATIASGENGQPAVLTHGRTGWIVPPCDEVALSEAITLLATNSSLRKEIGRKARIDAEKYHSWQRTAEELLSIFKQVMAKNTKHQ
jgi:glycosyltransferase involved in cell wall biosynthesis